MYVKHFIIQMTASGTLRNFDPFEVPFRPFSAHIGRYLRHNLTNAGFQFLNDVQSHDIGDQLTLPKREITRPGNYYTTHPRFVRHVMPTC